MAKMSAAVFSKGIPSFLATKKTQSAKMTAFSREK